MKSMTHALRQKIELAIKNKCDISDLIAGYNIKGLNLTGAIIQSMDVTGQDLRGTNFTRAILGTKETVIYLNNGDFRDCSFVRVQLPGKAMARYANFRGCNFKGAFVPYADYRYSDFRECNFCNTVFSIGTGTSYGAIFGKSLFKDLAKFWAVKITSKSMEEISNEPRGNEEAS